MEGKNLYVIKWMIFFIILLSILGGMFGVSKVLIFEQTPSGRFAVYKECDSERATPEEPCDAFKDTVDTLGKRQMEEAKIYAMAFGIGPGIVIGSMVAEARWKKKLMQ